MITVLQRVQHAKVEIDGKTVGATEQGLLILLGVAEGDTRVEADKLVKKIANLRIFEDENGKMNLSLLDIGGGVLVVNFWYAACGPCIVEAPMLEEVWQEYQDQGVAFLGVNTYDQPATALSFARDNNVTYPSVIDVNDGRVKLAFAQVTPIQATPTTLVIDRDGRVAARIIGQLASASILSTLVADTLAEDTS